MEVFFLQAFMFMKGNKLENHWKRIYIKILLIIRKLFLIQLLIIEKYVSNYNKEVFLNIKIIKKSSKILRKVPRIPQFLGENI